MSLTINIQEKQRSLGEAISLSSQRCKSSGSFFYG